MQNTHADMIQVLHDYMSDPETAWRIGEHAVFKRSPEEDAEVTLDHAGGLIVGDAGAVRIIASALTRLVPAEGLSDELWIQAGLLCLSSDDAAMGARSKLTELGNDMLAAQPIGRLGILFDLGLAAGEADICVRTDDDELCALLRARVGTSIAADLSELYDAFDAAGADFVVNSRLGRIESFGRRLSFEPLHGITPPEGYVAPMAFVPPRPIDGTPFDEATYGAFRVLYGIFADPALVQLKQSVSDALRDGAGPENVEIETPAERTAVAGLLRQLTARNGPSEALDRWRAALDL